MFLCFINYSTLTTYKDTGHFNAKSFRKCTHSEREGSHLEWMASLSIFSVKKGVGRQHTTFTQGPRSGFSRGGGGANANALV